MEHINKKPSRLKVVCTQKTKTQQAHRDQSLAKNICLKYQQTGTWSDRLLSEPNQTLQNTIDTPDYQEYHNLITQASNAFFALPQQIVSRFIEPINLINYLNDEKNHAEAQKLGLLPPTAIPPQTSSVSNGFEETVKTEEVPTVVPTVEN